MNRTASASSPTPGWIISPRADLAFFLATPLFLAVVFGLAERYWNLAGLAVFSTVLAMGHYLPGLMRAYGDPELFRRFRWRFILAPLFFIPTAVVLTRAGSQAFLMVVVVWGAWHWLMQTYGLARIYAAKNDNFDARSARLDYALCLAWFGVLYWWTDGAAGVLMHYYRAGGGLPPEWIRLAALIWFGATIAVTIGYVANVAQRMRTGHRPSLLKLALLSISFLFYLYAFGFSSSKLIAFGLFEGYHDIQYLAIVWLFNRNRVQKDPSAGSFTRFLFRQRWPLVALYVAMCLAFGSYDFVARSMTEQAMAQTAISIITGLALIHFYYDGFIWRMREPATRATLDVDDRDAAPTLPRLSPAAKHALLWVVILIPIVWLLVDESSGRERTDEDACRAVLTAMPNSHKAHYLLASVLTEEGEHDEALRHAEAACALRPGYDLYEILYADLRLGEEDLSDSELAALIHRYAAAEKTRSEVPVLHRNWARALRRQGDWAAAATRYQVALLLDPAQADCYYDYAVVMARLQKIDAARQACQEACRLDPDYAEAHALLGSLLMASNQPAEAISSYSRAISLAPDKLQWQSQLALALATSSDQRVRDPQEAERLADSLRDQSDDNPDVLRDLAMVYATVGRTGEARGLAERAASLFELGGDPVQAGPLRAWLNRRSAPER